jgi:glutathione S-transferase
MELGLEWIAIVTGLAVLQAFYFAFQVGQAREKHGVNAPAMAGHEEFERVCRIHSNTIEQLVIYLPGLWIFGYYVDARIGAGIGLLFIIGRFVYRGAYLGDPKKRSAGFGIGALSMVVLVVGGMIGAGMDLM